MKTIVILFCTALVAYLYAAAFGYVPADFAAGRHAATIFDKAVGVVGFLAAAYCLFGEIYSFTFIKNSTVSYVLTGIFLAVSICAFCGWGDGAF